MGLGARLRRLEGRSGGPCPECGQPDAAEWEAYLITNLEKLRAAYDAGPRVLRGVREAAPLPRLRRSGGGGQEHDGAGAGRAGADRPRLERK